MIEAQRSGIVAEVKELRRQLESGNDLHLLVWVIAKAHDLAVKKTNLEQLRKGAPSRARGVPALRREPLT